MKEPAELSCVERWLRRWVCQRIGASDARVVPPLVDRFEVALSDVPDEVTLLLGDGVRTHAFRLRAQGVRDLFAAAADHLLDAG